MYKARLDENGCPHMPSPSEFLDILGLNGVIDSDHFTRMVEESNIVSEDEKRFSNLLRRTKRPCVDELLKWLKNRERYTC